MKSMIAEKFDDGGYWNMPLQQYFETWKAARGSIEIELLEPGHYDRITQFAEDVYEALRTAGIRIKGESE
ncbi:hypothetical protein [Yersinia rochesterensis]|uniref:hypothetical protein n=1 Tax=Yersinia rochesterensis TaxID=1604335 RepID=UPI002867FF0E|nr:hypothetical protein [Yersinia rochesterensis]